VKLSLEVTVMLWVVAPLLQEFPEVALDVRITLPPVQNVVGPLALMVGTGGNECTKAKTEVLLEDTQDVVVFLAST
jgi:hypothetical protein